MPDYTITMLPPESVRLDQPGSRATEFEILNLDTFELTIFDDDDRFSGETIFDNDPEDENQVISGSEDSIYIELGYRLDNGALVYAVESNGTLIGWAIEGGPAEFESLGTGTNGIFAWANFNDSGDFESAFPSPTYASVQCFGAGTLIETDEGLLPVETIVPGMRVRTLEHGWQVIAWSGASTVPAIGEMAPIRFEAGAIGNVRPLILSPEHRVLLQGGRVEAVFGYPEGLAAARDLINGTTIRRVEGGVAQYCHLLCAEHEILYADGALCESLHPSPATLDAMPRRARREILTLFPEFAEGGCVPPLAKPIFPAGAIVPLSI
ncbi:MAG: Hint domain-containing protein [Pseudomonadota bacterium]